MLATGPKAHCVVVDASNRYVYCTNLGADIIMQLRFDAEAGTVSPNQPAAISTKPNAGPRHHGVSPERAVSLSAERDRRDARGLRGRSARNGTLAEVQTVPTLPLDFTGKPSAADLHVRPDGLFVYSSERTTSTIKGYRIDPERGTFSRCGRWPTETTPRGFAIDPRGRFLLAAGLSSNAMTVSAIDAESGALCVVAAIPARRNAQLDRNR